MHPSLHKIFDALENKKAELLKQVVQLSDEQLNYSVRPGRWSINQILSHLLTAERFSVNYIKKKSAGIENVNNSGIVELFKSAMLTISQRLPFLRFKAPRIIDEATPHKMSLQEIIEEWDNVRKEMKETLDCISDENFKKKIYRHPVAGYLNARQGIGFLYQHLLHHLPQIRRLVKLTALTLTP